MINDIAENLIKLKHEFTKIYQGTSQIQEVIPISKSNRFPIDKKYLDGLHLFAKNNPIYYDSYELNIDGVPCIVYEGNIDEYWINSIQHEQSHAPFSPTWILSAYVVTSLAKIQEYNEIIDIGSGDGRIAYCGKMLGLESHSIELDDVLVDLQKLIIDKTRVNFNPICANAVEFDYSGLNLTRPVFAIGGLAQMGGDVLASGVIKKINSDMKYETGVIFVGTYSKKYSSNASNGGWSTIIENHCLSVVKTISLPTVWTFREQDDSPYIFTKF